ncbi:uncharacterized protein LOC108268760 [Ictalurus punctatus]|uniref:Uncharacterized protein LOC108268760 n=1 Tax=Ictalurus punctatus TaxID=7998 RepID=A0A9F7TK45_ICTPU|nr:uncharacterized protein LOC108268760 [Ictalurus punctatus]
MNTHEKTVPGLGTALCLCALLIFCLIYFILRRRKRDKINASADDCPGLRQESHVDSLTYEALQLFKRKFQPGERDYLVYTDVMYVKL